MTPAPPPAGGPHRDPLARLLSGGALLAALAALVFSMTGSSPAAPERPAAVAAARRAAKRRAVRKLPGASTRPRPFGILRLDRRGRFPAAAIPKVRAARAADLLAGTRLEELQLNCPSETVDLGTWCLDSSTFPITQEEAGRNDFLFAVKKCVERGGWLPTAAQLLGAADRVKLSGTIDDSELTAWIDESPEDGRKDQREMSGSLFTTTAGSSAAGSQGVTAGSRGNPLEGEPDPVPEPADPEPSTLQYVTVFDNRDKGGFAGGKAVNRPERFRCAFAKVQGVPVAER